MSSTGAKFRLSAYRTLKRIKSRPLSKKARKPPVRKYERSHKKVRKYNGYRMNKLATAIEDRIATHDHYATNKGIIWDSNANEQGLVVNTNNDIMLEKIISDPARILLVKNYLAGFFTALQKFRITSQQCQAAITSRSNSAQFLEVYMWKCRRDLPKTADWTDLKAFYNYGLLNTGNTVTVSGVSLGHKPFDNPLWCQYFKCVKVYKKRFMPHGEMIINWKAPGYAYDSLRDGGFIEHLAYRNQTVILMPRIVGPIVHDTVAPFTQISATNGGYLVMYNFSFRTAFIEEAAHDSKFVSTLTLPTTARRAVVDNTATLSTAPALTG